MSVADDGTVLGKRERDATALQENYGEASKDQEMSDSDDDVGPMPMPEQAGASDGTRKKRKGMLAVTG